MYISEVRNGFAHEAMFKRVAINHGAQFALNAARNLKVDPWWILDTAENHFKSYVAILRAKPNVQKLRTFQHFMTIRKQR